jgi:hypothetical protein
MLGSPAAIHGKVPAVLSAAAQALIHLASAVVPIVRYPRPILGNVNLARWPWLNPEEMIRIPPAVLSDEASAKSEALVEAEPVAP